MHQGACGNDLSEIGYGSTLCITKGQSEIHISSWFGLWMHWAVLAVSNIPSKWVCSPHWEAKSIKQLLWHLENPFTVIETIQLKPLQSVLSFSRASTSHVWFFFFFKYIERKSNLHINTKRMTSILVCQQSAESLIQTWDCKEWQQMLSTWNTGCIATARLIRLTVYFLFW